MKLRAHAFNSVRSIGYGVAIFLLAFVISNPAIAATHAIGPSTASVDCKSFNGGIRPGDTILLSGRSRGPVTITDCFGTANAPISIRNDGSQSGPLVIEYGGSGFQSRCVNCEHVVLDGTGKWQGAPAGMCGANLKDGDWQLGTNQCGIVFRCTNGSPHSGLRFSGSSKFATIKGVEIDGNSPVCKDGTGLSVNDHQYVPKSAEWREGFVITNVYIHDTGASGLYFGPNQAHNAKDDLLVRNNEIAYNYLDHLGCDGIKYKSVVAGASQIHHNYVKNTGQSNGKHEDGCTSNGIMVFEGGFTEVFSNYVEAPNPNSSGAGNCIVQATLNLPSSIAEKLPVEIYNNVVRNCGGKGIASTGGKNSNAKLVPTVYNNTIVGPVSGGGIEINSKVQSCTVRDNILAGVTLRIGSCVASRNLVSDIASLKFRDANADDFQLTSTSPAIDKGAQCPLEDQIGNERPQGGACDQGALEFIVGQSAPAKPSPPTALSVD